jgi:glycosyltransferase involved in cell wall biosynthesis
MTAPAVTVAVPVKDRREQMQECLDAILAQSFTDYEVLILDNGSADGTAEACRERAGQAAVPIRVEHVEGPVGHVRNVGAQLARGELIAFTDSDCLPEPGWLAAGVAALRADPELVVVCGRTLPADEPTQGWPATIHVYEMTWRFESCNVFYRRDALVAADGFHETGFGWEDAAAGWSVLSRGGRAGFAPDAVVRHDVTYPGYLWQLRRARQHRFAAGVVRSYPAARKALWGGVFIDRRHAEVVSAAVGVLGALRRPWLLVLALPLIVRRRPRRLSAQHVKAQAQMVVLDATRVASTVAGAVDERTVVI